MTRTVIRFRTVKRTKTVRRTRTASVFIRKRDHPDSAWTEPDAVVELEPRNDPAIVERGTILGQEADAEEAPVIERRGPFARNLCPVCPAGQAVVGANSGKQNSGKLVYCCPGMFLERMRPTRPWDPDTNPSPLNVSSQNRHKDRDQSTDPDRRQNFEYRQDNQPPLESPLGPRF